MNDTTMHLITGTEFDFADPMACEAITEHDLAHALARISRYGGHCAGVWSVAQHTLLVYQLVFQWYRAPDNAFGALHHDDAEFVTGDWPTPLKAYVRSRGFDYARELERPIETAIGRHLGLVIDDLHAGVVKDADAAAYEIEIGLLKPAGHHSVEEIDDDLRQYGENLMMQLGSLEAPEVEQVWRSIHAAWVRRQLSP